MAGSHKLESGVNQGYEVLKRLAAALDTNSATSRKDIQQLSRFLSPLTIKRCFLLIFHFACVIHEEEALLWLKRYTWGRNAPDNLNSCHL